jgi:hypothetical protein
MDPSGEQWLTDVGGTELTTAAPGAAWSSETVWPYSGGGYGNDTKLPSSTIPWWQVGVPNSSNQGSTNYRNFPDVALTASCIWITCSNGSQTISGGTSAAAPLWAGLTALANQVAAGNRFPAVGFLNPALYTIGQSANYGLCFHDITTGNNENSCSPSQFTAVPGYDLCTGWGTPAGLALINELIRVSSGALGCGTFGSGSFWFPMEMGAAAPSSYVYWDSHVTTPPASWTLLSSYAPGSGMRLCSDSGAGSGVAARFYRVQCGAQCWRPTGFARRQIAAFASDLVASPFDAPVNTLNGLFNPMPDGTYLPTNAQIQVQNPGTWTFTTYTWSGSSWSSGGDSLTLSPGQGFWITNTSPSQITVTFAGLVRQGSLTNSVPNYESIYSSQVPQAGLLQTQLNYTPNSGDTVYVWNGVNYNTYTYAPPKGQQNPVWSPSEPSIALAQSFVLQPAGTNQWVRSFTTCQ